MFELFMMIVLLCLMMCYNYFWSLFSYFLWFTSYVWWCFSYIVRWLLAIFVWHAHTPTPRPAPARPRTDFRNDNSASQRETANSITRMRTRHPVDLATKQPITIPQPRVTDERGRWKRLGNRRRREKSTTMPCATPKCAGHSICTMSLHVVTWAMLSRKRHKNVTLSPGNSVARTWQSAQTLARGQTDSKQLTR